MEWINIKDNLPSRGEKILAFCLAEYQYVDEIFELEIQVAYMESIGEWYLDDKNLDKIHLITHWMKLPNKPNAQNQPLIIGGVNKSFYCHWGRNGIINKCGLQCNLCMEMEP